MATVAAPTRTQPAVLDLDRVWQEFETLAARGEPVVTLGGMHKRHRLRVFTDRISFTSQAGTTVSVDRHTLGEILAEFSATRTLSRGTLAGYLRGKQRPSALAGLLALLPQVEYSAGPQVVLYLRERATHALGTTKQAGK